MTAPFTAPPAAPPKAHYQLTKIRYTHEDCINMILANPWMSQNELAERYGYSPSWVSTVMGTDAFQARLAERRAEMVDPVLTATLTERFRALTSRSIEVLQEKLSLPSNMVPDDLALKAAALGAKSLGLGVAPPPPPVANNLEALAERLRAFVRRPQEGVVDVQAREVPPLSQGEGDHPSASGAEVAAASHRGWRPAAPDAW